MFSKRVNGKSQLYLLSGSLNNLTFYSSFVFLLRCGSNKVFDAPSMVFFHPAKTLFLTFAGFFTRSSPVSAVSR